MAPMLDQHGSNMDPCWTNMVPTWTHVGPTWVQHGTHVGPTWVQHGPHVGPMWAPMGPQGTIVARDPIQKRNGTFFKDFTPEKWPLNIKMLKRSAKKNCTFSLLNRVKIFFLESISNIFDFQQNITTSGKMSQHLSNTAKLLQNLQQTFCPLLRGANAD